MTTIKKKSLVDQVHETLRKEIITLQLPLGSKLNVNELQGRLQVSTTPIREALNRLQQEGLVVYQNNIGAHVLSLTEHDIEEIQQLAMTLHCAAVRLSVANGSLPEMMADYARHLDSYRKAKTVHSEVVAVNAMIGSFYHHCGNRRLDNSMIAIQGQQLLLRYAYANLKDTRGGDFADYEQILQRIQSKDAEAICRILTDIADRMTQDLIREFTVKANDPSV